MYHTNVKMLVIEVIQQEKTKFRGKMMGIMNAVTVYIL